MKSLKLLKNEKLDLQNEIVDLNKTLTSKVDEYELRNNIKEKARDGDGSRYGIYHEVSELPDYETKWKNSFFIKHRLLAEVYGIRSISKDDISDRKRFRRESPFRTDTYYYSPTVVECIMVIPTPLGPRLKLRDPYNSILSDPLKNTPLEVASTWVGKILVVNLGIHGTKDGFPINRIKVLKFTLYDDLREKEE